jgi:hypothetical protein
MTDNYQLVYSQGHQYFKFTDSHKNIDSDMMLASTALLNIRIKQLEEQGLIPKNQTEENKNTQLASNTQSQKNKRRRIQ